MNENELSKIVIDAAINVHKELGPGLLESAYEHCLTYELIQREVDVKFQVPVPLIYKGIKLDCGYRLDLIIENKLIVEVKSVEALTDIHMAQMLTYLRLSNCRLGLLLNFNVILLKSGIKRVALNL
ncbi:MAG: GxxExxY protein [Chitinophagaceae bacterium]